jgi:hypothetical protein
MAEGNVAHTAWGEPLQFWDVPFALVGLGLAATLNGLAVGGYHLLWIGAPVALVAARRGLLPQLSRSTSTAAPITVGRRIGAYVLMVVGGFVALIAGGIFYAAASDAEHPATLWPALLIAGLGGLVAAVGVRRVT